MFDGIVKELEKTGCTVTPNALMSAHTTFRTGGPAEILAWASSIKSAENAYNFLYVNDIPFTVIGKGSNILVSDKGYKGVILKFCGDNYIADSGGGVFTASGGTAAATAISFAISKGYSGGEFAAAIPGTIGGHIAMNAGCYGREMKDIVIFCECITEGEKQYLNRAGCGFTYRGSVFSGKKSIILRASFKLSLKSPKEAENELKRIMDLKRKSQPDKPSAGSIFKRQLNPEILPARLIDEAGLKGLKIGGAEVSRLHSGFIINRGGATSQDIYRLINKIKEKIYAKYAVELKEEISFIGEF
jgi:UDP-N-acetylmuramate dehydrogenase